MKKPNELMQAAYNDLAHQLNDKTVHDLVTANTKAGTTTVSGDIALMHQVWLGKALLPTDKRVLFVHCAQRFLGDPDLFG